MALAGAALAGACGDPPPASISIRVHAPPPTDFSGRCPDDAPAVPIARGPQGPTTLRLTFRRPGRGGAMLCDAIMPLEGAAKLVAVPRGETELAFVDLEVEAFRGDPDVGAVLVGSGQSLGLDLEAGEPAEVFVTPRDRFACTSGRMRFGRAFHSATALPNGEVLIVGGLVADPSNASVRTVSLSKVVGANTVGGFYAAPTAEIYDPETGAFRAVTIPGTGPRPRAFHEAYLVPDAGEVYQVVLVGGVTVDPLTPDAPAADGVRDTNEPARLVPAPQATAAPTEVLTYDPGHEGTISVTTIESGAYEARMFQAATRPPPMAADVPAVQWPALVAAGWRAYPASWVDTLEEADPGTGASATRLTLPAGPGRAGASLTRLGYESALLWGGNLGSAAGSEAAEAGVVVTSLGTETPAAAAAVVAAGVPAARAFHVAIPVSDQGVLVAGGFLVSGGTTGEPVAPFAQVIDVDPAAAAVTVTDLAVDNATPAGYQEAISLMGADALLTGGNPASSADPCGYFCALADAYRWNVETQTLARLPEGLKVARWGHRMTSLVDGTVLVTGGLAWIGDSLEVLPDAEVFNPRTEAMDPAADDPGLEQGTITRAAGDWARNPDGSLFSPCVVQDLPP